MIRKQWYVVLESKEVVNAPDRSHPPGRKNGFTGATRTAKFVRLWTAAAPGRRAQPWESPARRNPMPIPRF